MTYIMCRWKCRVVQELRSKGTCIHPRGVSERCRAAETYVRLTERFLQSLCWRQVPRSSAVKNPPAMKETWVQSLGQGNTLEVKWLPTPGFLPGEFHRQKNLGATVHGVAKSRTGQSDNFHFQEFAGYTQKRNTFLGWECLMMSGKPASF